MTNKDDNKPLPHFKSDEDARKFTDEADLSEYDLSGFRPLSSFEFAKKKDARLEMRIAEDQLKALKTAAKAQGIPYSRLARMIVEQGIKAMQPSPK